MALKNVSKSIRITDAAFAAIDGYRGEGFNEKLCNLVDDFICGEARMLRDRDLLRQGIEDKHQELIQIQRRVERAREIDRRFAPLVDALARYLEL